VRAYITQAQSYHGDDALSDQEIYSTALCLVCGKKRCLQGYSNLMEINIARARQPYISRSPLPPGPSDILSQQIRPEYDQMWFRALNTETQNGLLLVALALHAYRLEHGNYPPSLVELVPSHLQNLPDDPFALHGSFDYRNEGEKFVLYSIGPDGKDDSGKPIDNPKYTDSHYRLQVQSESQGDIVAGVNFR